MTPAGLRHLAQAIRAAVHDKRLELRCELSPRIFVDADIAIGAVLAPFDLDLSISQDPESGRRVEQYSTLLRAFVDAFWAIRRYGPTFITWPHLTELHRHTEGRIRQLTSGTAAAGLRLRRDLETDGNERFASILELIDDLRTKTSGEYRLSYEQSLRLSEALTTVQFPVFEVCSWKSPVDRFRQIQQSLQTSISWEDVKTQVSKSESRFADLANRLWEVERSAGEGAARRGSVRSVERRGETPRTNTYADAAALVQLQYEIKQAPEHRQYVRFYSQTRDLYRFCIADEEMRRSLAVRDASRDSAVVSDEMAAVDSRVFPLRSSQYMYLRAVFPSLMVGSTEASGGPSLADLDRFADMVHSLSRMKPGEQIDAHLKRVVQSSGIDLDASGMVNSPIRMSFANSIWLTEDDSLFAALGGRFKREIPPPESRRRMEQSVAEASTRVLEVDKEFRSLIDTKRVEERVARSTAEVQKNVKEIPLQATAESSLPSVPLGTPMFGHILERCLERLESIVRSSDPDEQPALASILSADRTGISLEEAAELLVLLFLECGPAAEPRLRSALSENQVRNEGRQLDEESTRKSIILEFATLWARSQMFTARVSKSRFRSEDPVPAVQQICRQMDQLDELLYALPTFGTSDRGLVHCCLAYVCAAIAFALRDCAHLNARHAAEHVVQIGLALGEPTGSLVDRKSVIGDFVMATHMLLQSEAHYIGVKASSKIIEEEYRVFDQSPSAAATHSLLYNYALMRMEDAGRFHPQLGGDSDAGWLSDMKSRIGKSATRFLPPTMFRHCADLLGVDAS